MKHLDVLAVTLKAEGVTHAFGVTGGGPSLHLINALVQEGVDYVPVAHEAAAAMMAGAACRSGQTKAVAIGIKGPGFANFYPGLVANHYENRPALVITEYYPETAPSARRHKRLDHVSAAAEVLKAEAQVDADGQATRALLARCRAEAPGPGLLQIGPAAVASAPASEIALPTRGSLEAILARLASSQRPAIVLGSLVARQLPAGFWDTLTLPVATTAAAKGCFNEYLAHSAGVVTGEGKELAPEYAVLRHADLILGIGLRNTEVVLANPYTCPLLSLDLVDQEPVSFRDGFEPELDVLVSDLLAACTQIQDLLAETNWGAEVILTHKQALQHQFGQAWAPPVAFRWLEGLDANLVLDTGYFCTVGETVWRARSSANFCGSSNGRFMGTALPTAIGLALAEPGTRTICVCGDGGIRPYLPELKVAVQRKLPILFVLMTDGLYGSIGWGGAAKGFDASAWTLAQPSWLEVVAAMGLPTRRATSVEELQALDLAETFKAEGPLYLELAFDASDYYESARYLR